MPDLETVTLPAGLTSIPKDAFANSVKLATVKFGTAGTNNGDGSTGITVTGENNKITLPSGITSIGKNAFASTAATAVNLSTITATGFTMIDNYVFKDMASLVEVKLPSSIATINQSAFQNDAALNTLIQADPTTSGGSVQVREETTAPTAKTAKFGKSLTRIGDQAFYGTGFTTVDLSVAGTATSGSPTTPLTVGSDAFTNMASLETVQLPANSNINPANFGNPTAEGTEPKLTSITYGVKATDPATITLTDQNISSPNFSKIANTTIQINSQTNQAISFNGGVFNGNKTMTKLMLNVTQQPNGNSSL